MSRRLLLVPLCLLLVIPSLAAGQAIPPPANGAYSAGWGYNPTNWNAVSGSWSSQLALYNPTAPELGGAGWVVTWNPIGYINYAPITLELWIEMYMIQTYNYTSYQWHRLGNAAENICFTIDGTMQSNEALWLSLTADPAYPPQQLTFMGNIGVGDNDNMRNIPVTYRGRWGVGFSVGNSVVYGWEPLTWSGGDLLFPSQIPACDHWFQFEGCFNLVYHEADGYYKLVLAGCPAPAL